MPRAAILLTRRAIGLLTLICALLFAPMAMAAERAHAEPASQAMGHCAHSGKDSSDKSMPVKPFRCMGACFGVQPEVTGLVERLASLHQPADRPLVAELGGISIARDPPPPRLT
jgi:hypothetical protein